MPTWQDAKWGGNTPDELKSAKVILWNGFCSVHKRFTVDQIDKARKEHPGVRVIVHPECPCPFDAADEAGSTDYIRRAIADATEPTTFAIGTEINMVQRLAAQYRQQHNILLGSNYLSMFNHVSHSPWLLGMVLERLVAGEVVNQSKF